MKLIDTHSHIYSVDFKDDEQAMMERAENNGVMKILMPAIDASTHDRMIELETRFPTVCRSMMGLHPCSVLEKYDQELLKVEEFLSRRNFIAIGETGLDFYWDLTYKDQQYRAFQRQIELSIQYNVPVVIHSRNSTDECIEMVRKNQQGSLNGVFHCFSGTIEQARQVMNLGFYLGIGGVLTFKNSGLDTVVREVGLDRVVLETDAPYLAPVPFRGKRNEPAYLSYIVEKLATIIGREQEEIAEITTSNAQKLFGL